MPAPATIAEFLDLGCRAGLLEKSKTKDYCQRLQQERQSR